jgi:cobalt-zinc-cadmium resistance protein CzcA
LRRNKDNARRGSHPFAVAAQREDHRARRGPGSGSVDPKGQFEKPGAAVICREQAKRLIAVKFSVRGRGLMWIIPLSLGLIFILLYSALRSWLDALVVLTNVLAMAMGGVWALCLTGTNFSISTAVGFISLFGVAIMDGLLLISYFNTLRSQGRPLHEAIIEGASKRVRPVMMTDLTALCGSLPAALSTQIGSQPQRPLAIVVVGGMATMFLLTRYLTPVRYSFYGHGEPPAETASLAH